MNRRPFLQTLATAGAVVSAGCLDSLSVLGTNAGPDASDVFADYRYEGQDLVVEFRDDADVQRVVLYDSGADDPYETIEHSTTRARFPVVFPDRMETYVTGSPSLRVKAETPDGSVNRSVWEPVHGAVRDVTPLPDGRAALEIGNQTPAPLLVGFVAIYGDVPNPTVDPQRDAFDFSSFDRGPGVVGVAENQPLSPSRTDLVVPPEETRSFETTYAPFAFPDESDPATCDSDERTGTVAVVHGSGGSAAYDFTYRLEGEPSGLDLEDGTATVCTDPVATEN